MRLSEVLPADIAPPPGADAVHVTGITAASAAVGYIACKCATHDCQRRSVAVDRDPEHTLARGTWAHHDRPRAVPEQDTRVAVGVVGDPRQQLDPDHEHVVREIVVG